MSNIPSNASLYIGPGLRVEGRITQTSKDEMIVVAGTLAGDIVSEGVVLVTEGGVIEASNELRCFEMQVKGKIEGKDVTLEAGLLKLGETSRLSVGEINLPPGGLEQSRGSVLCARLTMSDENAFAKDERLNQASAPAAAAPQSAAAPLSGLKVQPPVLSSPASTPASTTSASAPASTAAASSATATTAPASAGARVLPLGTASSSSSTATGSAFRDDEDDQPRRASPWL